MLIDTECPKSEGTRFLEFVYKNVARKRRNIDTSPTFKGTEISSSFIMIGKEGTMYHPECYIKRIEQCISNNIRYVHLLAAGGVNVAYAEFLSNKLLREKGLKPMMVQPFERETGGVKMKAVIISYDLTKKPADD